MTTIRKLQNFRAAMQRWKDNKGSEGQGGNWIPSQRKYETAAKPDPKDFGLSGYEIALAEKIEKQVMEAR